MSDLRSVLACLLLLASTCQANTGGVRASTSSQGTGLLSNALVGLGAVAGFLFIVFIILIVKRVFFQKDRAILHSRDEDKEELHPEVCATYENKALEVETPDEAKTTSM